MLKSVKIISAKLFMNNCRRKIMEEITSVMCDLIEKDVSGDERPISILSLEKISTLKFCMLLHGLMCSMVLNSLRDLNVRK